MLPRESVPIGGVPYALLIACWKHPRTNEELAKVSGQVAKPAQMLRDLGFIFRKGNPVGKCWTFHENGKEYREILDYQPSDIPSIASWNRLRKDEADAMWEIFGEDMDGKIPKCEREIDHRIPENVRKQLGLPIIPLTRQSLEDGTWRLHYQLTRRSRNVNKRSACEACQHGDIIPLPPLGRLMSSAYRQRFNEPPANVCEGCLYYNFLRPKNPNLVPNLVSELKQDEEKQMRLACKLKQVDNKRSLK